MLVIGTLWHPVSEKNPRTNSNPPTESFDLRILEADTCTVPPVPTQEDLRTLLSDITQIEPTSNSTVRYITLYRHTNIKNEMDFEGELSYIRAPPRTSSPVSHSAERPPETYQSEFQVDFSNQGTYRPLK
jgi:hypothetical protein